ncbi:hypothetical protein [uncultured Psychroserpens sp.]|uniref:hypothetical protein n=1 Tax=uncultured Psychroserpens sp. TaxID=255436 RepID=UPI00261947B0|nr:hypothetical protein [uncultured Psychroserpens sp.]
MKKTLITLLFIALTLSAFGQKKQQKDKIRSLKIAFITDQLDLTEAEAQKFWPIYNAHDKEMEMLRINGREKRRKLNIESLTENEAKKALKDLVAFEKEMHALKAELTENLLTAIPAKKILKLRFAETAFNKRMLEEMKKRREKFKKNRP